MTHLWLIEPTDPMSEPGIDDIERLGCTLIYADPDGGIIVEAPAGAYDGLASLAAEYRCFSPRHPSDGAWLGHGEPVYIADGRIVASAADVVRALGLADTDDEAVLDEIAADILESAGRTH